MRTPNVERFLIREKEFNTLTTKIVCCCCWVFVLCLRKWKNESCNNKSWSKAMHATHSLYTLQFSKPFKNHFFTLFFRVFCCYNRKIASHIETRISPNYIHKYMRAHQESREATLSNQHYHKGEFLLLWNKNFGFDYLYVIFIILWCIWRWLENHLIPNITWNNDGDETNFLDVLGKNSSSAKTKRYDFKRALNKNRDFLSDDQCHNKQNALRAQQQQPPNQQNTHDAI